MSFSCNSSQFFTHHVCRSLTYDGLLGDLLRPEAVLTVLRPLPAVLGDVLDPDHVPGGAEGDGAVDTAPSRFLRDCLEEGAINALYMTTIDIILRVFGI